MKVATDYCLFSVYEQCRRFFYSLHY